MSHWRRESVTKLSIRWRSIIIGTSTAAAAAAVHLQGAAVAHLHDADMSRGHRASVTSELRAERTSIANSLLSDAEVVQVQLISVTRLAVWLLKSD